MASVYCLLKINNIFHAYDKDKSILQVIKDGLRDPAFTLDNQTPLLFMMANFALYENYLNLTCPLPDYDCHKILCNFFSENSINSSGEIISKIMMSIPFLYGYYKINAYVKQRELADIRYKKVEDKWTTQEQAVLAKGLAI